MNLDRIIAVRTSKTVYRDGDKAIKVFDDNYSKADVLNEALNQARVEETNLHVPKILEVTKVDGKWAIVSEFIAGKSLKQLIADDPDHKEAYLQQMVDLQIAISSQRCPLLNRLKDKMQSKISKTDLNATIRYDLHTRLDALPKHDKLCHGDLTPSNIIISEDQTPYILDWAHATQGNASADVARSYLTFSLAGDNATAEQYMDMYCNATDTAKQYVQKWLPIVAASQSVKGKPEERQLLLRWVDVVDYT